MEAKNEQYSKTGLMGCFCSEIEMLKLYVIKASYIDVLHLKNIITTIIIITNNSYECIKGFLLKNSANKLVLLLTFTQHRIHL